MRRMNLGLALPVVMPNVPGQRWSCQSCGECCRTLVGHLSDDERERIERQNWTEKLGAKATVRLGRGWVLNKRDDGACVFLDDDNRCRIHAEFGEDAKPLACRIFPFSVRPTLNGWQASLRFDCPSVVVSQGEPLAGHRAAVSKLAERLDHSGETQADTAYLQPRLPGTIDEMDAVTGRTLRWIKSSDLGLGGRLLGAARVTTTLAGANLAKVRGPRFAELVDLLFGSGFDELISPPAAASDRQLGMLRQLAFAHAEFVTLRERRAWIGGRLLKRWQQLRHAKMFRRGEGIVPPLPGFEGSVTFEQVELVGTLKVDDQKIADLLQRYIVARIEGRSIFGRGYYGWSVFGGMTALWLSIAVAGWLARHAAALDDRTRLTFADVGYALGIVDRAATRVPALGAFAERARVVYLLRDDGIARLLQAFALWDTDE